MTYLTNHFLYTCFIKAQILCLISSLQNGKYTEKIKKIFIAVRVIGSSNLVLMTKYNTIHVERLVVSKMRINIENK